MTFVQYYHTDLSGRLAPALGDRAVVILDGRWSLDRLHREARACNGRRRPRYEAYRIMRGRGIGDARPITPITHLEG